MKKILYLLMFVLFFYISLPVINYYALTKTFFFDTLDDCLKSDVITLCPDSLAVEPENIRIKFFVETNQLDVIFVVRKETNTYLKKIGSANEKGKDFFVGKRLFISENIYCYIDKYGDLYVGTDKLEVDKYIYDLSYIDKRYGDIGVMCKI